MKNTTILDCTLRDGGYVNNWTFGNSTIKRIVNYLTDSNLDFIECGYLSNQQPYNPDQSIFDTIDRFKEVIPEKRRDSNYVCMINFGEFEIIDIPEYDGTSIKGIRVVFHKDQVEAALEYCEELMIKGYLVFVQPMVTINYSDDELLHMIKKVNVIKPYAFYIVDSFGVMKKTDLLRLFYIIDHNLFGQIRIGYHSHNNLQLAYSNAQALVEVQSSRMRIIDSSVYGIGRGAGNLNTELFVQYLNDYFEGAYNVYPLLQIIDESLSKIYTLNYWGYSLPHYLSALYNCHPNYASYLSGKNTLTVKAIQDILSRIPIEKRQSFNREYTEKLYISHQRSEINDFEARVAIKEYLKDKKVLVIAPGQSIKTSNENMKRFIAKNKPVCISVNFIPDKLPVDIAFISNTKRYEQIRNHFELNQQKCIFTSNIEADFDEWRVNYSELLNLHDSVSDNSTLMLLTLLDRIDVKHVYMAGFDGYSYDNLINYADKELVLGTNQRHLRELNQGIAKVLNKMKDKLSITFLTPTKYEYLFEDERYL